MYWNPEPTVGLWMADCCASSVYRVKTNVVWRRVFLAEVNCGFGWVRVEQAKGGQFLEHPGTQLGDMPSCEQGGSRI